jgi:hypothetical protein
MTQTSRRLAGILLIALPVVIYGGTILVSQLMVPHSGQVQNPLRQDLLRAGHIHAGVLILLSLVTLRYVDEAVLPNGLKAFVRFSIPASAVLLPSGFFFSMLSPTAPGPGNIIYLTVVGAALLASGVFTLGIGLVRRPRTSGGS